MTELERELAWLKPRNHVCLIYDNAADQLSVVIPFLRQALARGERILYIVDDRTAEEIFQALASAQLDAGYQHERGALRFLTKQDAYLRLTKFIPEPMIDYVRQQEEQALRDGFSGLCLTGEMTWACVPGEGNDRLIEYEALLNQLERDPHLTILCQYNRFRLEVPSIHAALRTHPLVITGDALCRNPFYERPEIVLDPDTAGSSVRNLEWRLSQLQQGRLEEREHERIAGDLRLVIDTIPAFIWSALPDGSFDFLNQRCLEYLGLSLAEARGWGWTRALHPEDREQVVNQWRAVLAAGEPTEMAVRLRRTDGAYRWFLIRDAPLRDDFGNIVKWYGVSIDIEDRKRAEEKLKKSEQRLAEAQHVAHIGSWERDLRTNEVTWSDELYRLFGLQPQERVITYEEFLDFVSPEDRDKTQAVVEKALHDREPFSCDYRIALRDGGTRILYDRGEIVLNDDGEPVRLVGTAQDITERRQAEQALKSYATRLEALSRRLLEVKEVESRHLARELHDEIGQLLTGLRLLLKPNGDLSNGTLSARLEQARAIVDELLERARGLSFDLRPADLDQFGLLPALLALFERYTAQTRVLVDFKHQGVEGRFASEVETAAYRVVQEALTNAARHAGVSAVTVRAWTDADTLHLQIEDQGCGFDPDVILEAPRSSGLPGMRERIMLLGGRMSIESSPGSGTTITADLPLNRTTTA